MPISSGSFRPGRKGLSPIRLFLLLPLDSSNSFLHGLRAPFACRTWRCEGPFPRAEMGTFSTIWCNVSLLDATLLSPLLCVASKGLAQYLSLVDATLTKNIGVTSFKPRVFSLLTFPVCSDVLPIYPRSLPSLDKECFITLLRSMSSALFLKTAGCTGSLPVLELATRPSPLATSFASSTHSRGRPSNRRKLNHAVS